MPRTANTILVSLGPDLLAAVKSLAAKRNCTAADIIREAVAQHLRKPKLAASVRRGRPRAA